MFGEDGFICSCMDIGKLIRCDDGDTSGRFLIGVAQVAAGPLSDHYPESQDGCGLHEAGIFNAVQSYL